jgi:hypothetical protein
MRGMGMTPLVVRSLDDAVTELRHGFFTVVLLDGTRTDVDSLEFVLNVRDVDPAVPIVILGPCLDDTSNGVLHSQQRVYRLDSPKTPMDTARALENVLEGRVEE